MSFKNRKSVKIIVFYVCLLWLAAVFCVACVGSGGRTEDNPTREEVAAKVLRSTCTILADENSGTGFVFRVEDNVVFVATNYHVVKNAEDLVLRFEDGQSLDGRLLGFNEYHDLAVILVMSQRSIPAVEFKLDELKMGQDAYLIGNALNRGLSLFEGVVSKPIQTTTYKDPVTQSTKRVPVVAITTPINEGSSGSPVFDSFGRVFGIGTYQTFSYSDKVIEGMNYAVPIKIAKGILNQIIQQAQYGNNEPTNSLGLSVVLRVSGEDDSALYLDFEGLNFYSVYKDGQLEVTDSFSIALEYGEPLEKGDIITRIGGLELEKANLFDIFAQMNRYIDIRASLFVTDKLLSIKYIRNGAEKELGFFSKYEKDY